MEVIITKVMVGICSLFGILLSAYIISYFVKDLKNNSNPNLNFVYNIVSTAVVAAEQLVTEKSENSGLEKRTMATNFIKSFLKRFKIELSDNEIRTILEAAVYELNQEQEAIKDGSN